MTLSLPTSTSVESEVRLRDIRHVDRSTQAIAVFVFVNLAYVGYAIATAPRPSVAQLAFNLATCMVAIAVIDRELREVET